LNAHAGDSPPSRTPGSWIVAAWPALALALLCAVGFVLHRELEGHHLHDVLLHLRSIPADRLVLASGLAAASYWLLGFFDVLGLRYTGKHVRYASVLFTAFLSYAFGHNIGVATLTGGAIRYRMYSAAGLSTTDVATVSGFCTLTSAIGLMVLIGAGLLLETSRLSGVMHIGHVLAVLAGLVSLAFPVAYATWGTRGRRPLSLRGWSIDPPGASIVLPQLLLGVADVALAGAVLWVLLPASADVSPAAFASIYAVASSAGLISHVPGGLGVFESVILLALPDAPADELLGALLAYRTIYYLLPLLLAAVLFGSREFVLHRERLARVGASVADWIGPVVPQVAGSLTLLAGLVLLLSGATPGLHERLAGLREWLPLPVLELSHVAGSITGLALIILSRALFRRSAAACRLVLWALAAGIVASLLKGMDYEEAALLALVMAVIWLGRDAFYRSSPALKERLTPGWIATLVAVLMVSAWIGFLAHRSVAYTHDLWWTFAFDADAPRMLRATMVVSLAAAVFLLTNLLGNPRPSPHVPGPDELDRARRVIHGSRSSLANAALTGDKELLFSGSGDAFVMYQRTGRAWIALGDPVGPDDAQPEAAWRFHEDADREGAWTVFYQGTARRLPMYVDLGLSALKIGEEARVFLDGFSLEGSAGAEFRHARRRAERDGASFEVLPPGAAASLLPDLQRISDEWLAGKSTGEKGFSVGRFSPGYLAQFPLAIVRARGRPTAFANLWLAGTGEEFSVDLMRFGEGAPRSAMDYLFTELMSWGRQQGFSWFSLGMAPLAGLVQHPLAPSWNRVGNFVFRHGEHFYNFEGLRHYKAKFAPHWEARYLLTPGGLVVPRVLTALSVLVAGGARQVLTK
jgi:phosphatidylglycerol lysyltransferase